MKETNRVLHRVKIRNFTKYILIVGAVALFIGLFYIRLTTPKIPSEDVYTDSASFYDAQIISRTVIEGEGFENDPTVAEGTKEVQLTLRLEDGRTVGIRALDESDLYETGRKVIVQYLPNAGAGFEWTVIDVARGQGLFWLALVFVVAVIGLMRMQGVTSLVGLFLSMLIIIWIVAPAIMSGQNALLVATIGAMAVMWIVLPLSHGLNWTTAAAMLGTSVSLLFTVGLTWVSSYGVYITGLVDEDARNLRYLLDNGVQLDLRGILMAGVIIGTLGVLDDVTVAQASTVNQLRKAAPNASQKEIIAGALQVGRDHMGASVNTLFLAYAGTSLPLLMMFSLSGVSFLDNVTSELVAQEVVRTLAGSIGLIAAVPLTTVLAALIIDENDVEVLGHSHTGHAHGMPVVSDTTDGDDNGQEKRIIDIYGSDS